MLGIRRWIEAAPDLVPISVFSEDAVPLLPVVSRLDERETKVAQLPLIVSRLESRGRKAARRGAHPVMDIVADQARLDLAEVAVGARRHRQQAECSSDLQDVLKEALAMGRRDC